jgi:hypothetical protein
MNFSFRGWLNEEILRHNPFTKLLRASGLEHGDKISLIKKNAAGIVHIEDYLKTPPGSRPGHGGVALGMTDEAFLYDLTTYLSRVENWKEAYPRLTGDGVANTDEFMDKLTSQSKPIVFFVPSGVTHHHGVTSEEMAWYLAHPEKMRTTYFVFGLYDMVDKGEWEKYLLPHEPHDLPIMTGVLNNPQNHFVKGTSPHNPPPGSRAAEDELWKLKGQGDAAGAEPLSQYTNRMDRLQDVPQRYPDPKQRWRFNPTG